MKNDDLVRIDNLRGELVQFSNGIAVHTWQVIGSPEDEDFDEESGLSIVDCPLDEIDKYIELLKKVKRANVRYEFEYECEWCGNKWKGEGGKRIEHTVEREFDGEKHTEIDRFYICDECEKSEEIEYEEVELYGNTYEVVKNPRR